MLYNLQEVPPKIRRTKEWVESEKPSSRDSI